MFEGRRDNSFAFAGLMMGVVIVLNIVLLAFDATDLSEHGHQPIYIFGPFVVGGILGMGIACYLSWQKVPARGAARKDGARAGAIAVLLSYPMMGLIGFLLFAVGSIVIGDPLIGSGFFTGNDGCVYRLYTHDLDCCADWGSHWQPAGWENRASRRACDND